MLLATLLLLIQTPPDGHKPPAAIATLRVEGMVSSACYETVEKALKALPEITAVSYWIEKGNYHVHVRLAAPLRLSRVREALAAAVKEMKESSRMEVAYRLDETQTFLAPEGVIACTGGDEIIGVIKELIPVRSFENRDQSWLVTFSTLKAAGVTIAALRERIEKAGGKLTDLPIRSGVRPKARWRCPAGCSESPAAGICPKCARSLVEDATPPADAGG